MRSEQAGRPFPRGGRGERRLSFPPDSVAGPSDPHAPSTTYHAPLYSAHGPEDWDFIHAVNSRGLFFALQAGARQMLRQTPLGDARPSGKIINMASIAGRGGRAMLGAYAASKAAVINITQTAAQEFAPRLTVNSICPGPVDTEMWKQIDQEWSEQERRPLGSVWQDRVRSVPMQRGETPDDLTGMAVFLASADSDYVTGQSYNVDGGVVMS